MTEIITCKNNYDEIVDVPKEKFYFRPSVYGIIKNGNKILIVRTKFNNKIWFPGGAVNVGEKLDDALIRECFEETGLKITKIGEQLLFKENFFYYQPEDLAMHAYLFFYLCEVEDGELTINGIEQDEDLSSIEWIDINEIKGDDISDFQDEIFNIINNL
ncbi:MAG: NUDIX hydrolase [Candidatus Buchananbacteria bacterium]